MRRVDRYQRRGKLFEIACISSWNGEHREEGRGSSDPNHTGQSWRAKQEEKMECVSDFHECCEYRHGSTRMSSLLIWQHDVVIYKYIQRLS